jgi:zinc protease
MKKFAFPVLFLVMVPFLVGNSVKSGDLEIKYEKYVLKNGLKVILHEDKSDPVTAVAVQYHVGSNRELKGRTGLAHLFEHMMFQESQHVGQDQFFKKIQNAGGTLNGGTWNDGTIYYQVIPENVLEMVLWMESDRMGFLLSTITAEAFANQQEVVQNEKRQNYDNQPYGQTSYIIGKLLYHEDHPYNWQVIGSLEDLSNATLKDVHDFYKKWYGPNNATLVIAGSFDRDKTKEWVEKYFGEIKRSEDIELPKPANVTLSESKRAYYEDNFAKSPELNMVFPTIHQFTDDSYALDMLGELLSDGKKAPFYKVIVEEKQLAPSVSVSQNSLEMAGTFNIRVRSFPEVKLSAVEDAIKESFERFEKEKFTEQDLDRIKAKTETALYNGITSVLGKSFNLAIYNEYAGSPDYISTEVKKIMSVTGDDIWRVYNKYVKDRNFVMTSFVPKGKTELVADNSKLFIIEEENIAEQKTAAKIEEEVKVEKIPTAFDRTIEPSEGPAPALKLPEIWTKKLSNGIKIYGIEHTEVPLVQFSITLTGGMMLDKKDKTGTAHLTAKMLTEGTKTKTPVELEEAIDNLGAYLQVFATKESIIMQGNCLEDKFAELAALAEEILLEPRWDEKEFARLKEETLEGIRRSKANPGAVASNVFSKLLYGDNHPLANPVSGNEESISSITIDDLKNYYNEYFAPSVANITIAGSLNADEAAKTFSSLGAKWSDKKVELPSYKIPSGNDKAKVYFVDMPGAKQSELRVGYIALAYTDNDYYPATVMNYKLGGSFSGNINLILREEKGFTYGARTAFSGSANPGPFAASTAVQSNATLESLQIIRDEINKYRMDISDEDLMFTRNALSKSNALRFETLGALNGMLSEIAKYNLPFDYIKQQEKIILEMKKDQHLTLAKKYLDADKMIYLVVGDAATQLEQVKQLGLGDPILLDIYGNPVNN